MILLKERALIERVVMRLLVLTVSYLPHVATRRLRRRIHGGQEGRRSRAIPVDPTIPWKHERSLLTEESPNRIRRIEQRRYDKVR